MKIYMSADLEGVSGVVHREHTARDGREHDRAREWMTKEVNSAVKGALEAGAEEVCVNDSHGTMRNLIPELLHPEVTLITGSPKPMEMLEGLTREFDGAFFIGYHSRAGSTGVLNHTYSSATVSNLKVNGNPFGEFGLNSLVANHLGVRVALVSGDDILVEEARQLLPDLVTVVTKRALSRCAAKCVPHEIVRELIRKASSEAIGRLREGKTGLMKPVTPMLVEIRFTNSGMADVAQLLPGSERSSPLEVKFSAKDPVEAYKATMAMISLGREAMR